MLQFCTIQGSGSLKEKERKSLARKTTNLLLVLFFVIVFMLLLSIGAVLFSKLYIIYYITGEDIDIDT